MAMDVKTLCLGVLMRGDATGYEIRKEFESGVFSHFCVASLGAIYPALGKLSDDGLVTGRTEMQSGKPDRKVYSITPAGRLRFADGLSRSPSEERVQSDHLFLLFFAELQDPARIGALVRQMTERMRADVERIEGAGETCPAENAGHAFVRGYGLAVYRAALAYLERNRDDFLHLLDARQEPKAVVGGGKL